MFIHMSDFLIVSCLLCLLFTFLPAWGYSSSKKATLEVVEPLLTF